MRSSSINNCFSGELSQVKSFANWIALRKKFALGRHRRVLLGDNEPAEVSGALELSSLYKSMNLIQIVELQG